MLAIRRLISEALRTNVGSLPSIYKPSDTPILDKLLKSKLRRRSLVIYESLTEAMKSYLSRSGKAADYVPAIRIMETKEVFRKTLSIVAFLKNGERPVSKPGKHQAATKAGVTKICSRESPMIFGTRLNFTIENLEAFAAKIIPALIPTKAQEEKACRTVKALEGYAWIVQVLSECGRAAFDIKSTLQAYKRGDISHEDRNDQVITRVVEVSCTLVFGFTFAAAGGEHFGLAGGFIGARIGTAVGKETGLWLRELRSWVVSRNRQKDNTATAKTSTTFLQKLKAGANDFDIHLLRKAQARPQNGYSSTMAESILVSAYIFAQEQFFYKM